ncbi:hypothetical protein [Roseibium alexandrii]|uniref:Uncharacterized protein n=1 Tax=Roseibium alexandrii TaxID=388408 RepID=A0A0M7AHC1_9HYPH|nr:hypothetical protein [Roseibium alexandrii]CTQ73796.1 hypothetical protein LAX5112_03660 [Roseibium alexandrii]
MTADDRKPAMKSVNKPNSLRSRGFLSQPGSQVASGDGSSAKPNKSRGKRQSVVADDGKPAHLTTKVAIPPYKLGDT